MGVAVGVAGVGVAVAGEFPVGSPTPFVQAMGAIRVEKAKKKNRNERFIGSPMASRPFGI